MSNPFDKRQRPSTTEKVYVLRPFWAKVHGQVRQVFEGWVIEITSLEASEAWHAGRVRAPEHTDPAPITLDGINAFMQKRQEEAEERATRARLLDKARKLEAEDALLAKHGLLPETAKKRGKQEAAA